jgi:hypothetical protein
MAVYEIIGANRETGDDVQMKVEARSKKKAIEVANHKGVLVAEIRSIVLPKAISFPTKIVGVTRKNDDGTNRQLHISTLRIGDQISLRRERNNRHDCNAVACYIDDRKLGYLSMEVAEEIAVHMDAGLQADARVLTITGGTKDKPSFGCNIEITTFPWESANMQKEDLTEVLRNHDSSKRRRDSIRAIVIGCIILPAIVIGLGYALYPDLMKDIFGGVFK